MRKTAIVFGGTGFFGTHLARVLVERADVDRVVLADMRPPRESHPKVDFQTVDVREPIELEVSGEVEIYNFAAVHTTPGHEDWEYYWTNVRGATEVCRFARRVGARRLVFTSTMGIYGPQESQVDDRTIPAPTTAYGKSKLLAEKIHEDWQKEQPDRRLIVVRPAVTFGPGEHGNFTRLAKLLRRGWFVYPARKNTIKACAPVVDLASSIEFMQSFDEAIVSYIFAYPERTTTQIINQAFCRVGGFKEPNVVIPQSVITSVAYAFELLSKIGLKTSINRARVKKLIQSTNIYPYELTTRGWTFPTSLTRALELWKTESDFE